MVHPTNNNARVQSTTMKWGVPSQLKMCLMGIVVLAACVCLSIRNANEDPFITYDYEIARRVEEARASEGRFLVEGLENLRIAAFGGRITWGQGLENRNLAYPNLISTHVDNYAMISGGPNYPATCAHSLVGDDKVYDVILVEYYLESEQGLFELVQKLRHRFKYAMIVTVKLVGPLEARRRNPNDPKKRIAFKQWVKIMGLDDKPTKQVLEALEKDDGDWFFPERRNANSIGLELKNKFGVYRATLPPRRTDKEKLALYLQWFQESTGFQTMKPIGHEIMADMILGTIENKMHFGSVDGLRNKADHLGGWGPGDYCHFWPTPDSFVEEHSDTLQLTPMNKYNDKLPIGVFGAGNFTFTNPFTNPRVLYMSYLTNTDSYAPPTIQVKIEKFGVERVLDPSVTIPNHHIRTIPIGMVNPGTVSIFVDIIGEQTADPPRILGVTLPDGIVAPREYGFAPHLM